MNFKVRCIERTGSKYFTTGKIYQVINGMLIDDTGEQYSHGGFSSVKEINQSCISQFELVEGSKMFTKDDLKVNDWCVFRNGSVFRVASDSNGLCMVEKDSWAAMENFNLDLTHKELIHDLDVLRVYRPEKGVRHHLIQKYYSDGNLVFDREKGIGCEPPVKEISVDEATKLLTEKFGQNVRIRVGE